MNDYDVINASSSGNSGLRIDADDLHPAAFASRTTASLSAGARAIFASLAVVRTEVAGGHIADDRDVLRVRQLMISPRSSRILVMRSRHIASASGVWRVQSVISSMITSGSRVRNERVGLPGNFLSVTFGSSSNGPV